MNLIRDTDTIPSELQARENRPHFLIPQPWMANAALFVESWTRNHRKDLEKIGFKFDDLPYWKKYQLQDNEIRHGLPTYKAGEWKNSFLFNTHNDAEAELAQQLFASGMIWEMTKNLVGDRASLAIGLETKINQHGEVIECEPKVTRREWPMTVRVLKQGIDGKPVSFVDIVVERQDENPLNGIEWKRITNNDELYIKQISEKYKVSQARSLDDWYIEGIRQDKYGEYYRPDILVACNSDSFRLDQMSADRRPLLTIGLEQVNRTTTGVTVGVQTHLPFNGMDMMGMKQKKGYIKSRDAAFEAVVKDQRLSELIDGSDAGKANLAEYRQAWDTNRPKKVGLSSFLATRFANKNQKIPDESTQIETILTLTSFEESVMAEFCRLNDAQKVVDSLVLPPDLNKWLIELPKKIKEVSGEKVAGIMFLSLAMYLTDHEAQGFAVGPEAMLAIMGELGYASVGSEALNKIEAAGKIVSDEEQIKKANIHADKKRALLIIKDMFGRDKIPDKLVGKLEKLRNGKIEARDEAGQLARKYAGEILSQYEDEIYSVLQSSNSAPENDNPLSEKGGLVEQLYAQSDYFEDLNSRLSPPNNLDIHGFAEASGNLLNLTDGDFGFSLSRVEMIAVIEQVSNSNYNGEVKVVENGIDWGSHDPLILLERANRFHRILRNVTFDKYKREGIQWLLSRKENEVKSADETAVERLTNELTKQAGFLTSVAKEISENPAGAVSSMQVRLGIMAALEELGLYGAAGLVADSRPEENVSKIVVEVPNGFELIFETALAAKHTTVGVGQVNETISRKESADNPRAMMEVIVPYLRAKPNLAREMRLYLEKNNISQEEINLVTEMLYSEVYSCFTDNVRSSNEQIQVDTIDLWGTDYIDVKNRSARNAWDRKNQQYRARIFMKHFNGLLSKVDAEPYFDDIESAKELKWLMGGGFNELWSETNRYKLEQTKANLAQIALIFSLYVKSKSSSEENERMLLDIRSIQEREIQRLRGLKAKLKQVYQRGRGAK